MIFVRFSNDTTSTVGNVNRFEWEITARGGILCCLYYMRENNL